MEGKISVHIYMLGVLFSVDYIIASRFYELQPTPFICKVLDSDIVLNYTCSTRIINRTFHLTSREIVFNTGVEVTNYYVKIQILSKVGKKFRQVIVFEQDMCDFTRGNTTRDSSLLAKVLNREGRRKYGNMFESCPLTERRYEKEAIIDYSRLPEVIPAGEYRVDIFGYTVISGTKKNFILTECTTKIISKAH